MDRITSAEQYSQVVDRAAHEGYELSNCYFLPAAIQQMTDRGTLYRQDVRDGLLLLDDNGTFYRCYYYLSAGGHPEPVNLDKDAVIEFPFNGQMNARQLQQVALIEAMGFRLGRESSMMNASPDKISAVDGQAGALCDIAERRDAAGILSLLQESFNPMYAFLPDQDQLETAISQGLVFVIRNENEVAAALVSSFEKRVASIDQIAVNPAFRRRGYAGMLMGEYHRRYADRAAAFRHWVDINNAVAVGMYLGLGYVFSLRKANEYILLRRRENE